MIDTEQWQRRKERKVKTSCRALCRLNKTHKRTRRKVRPEVAKRRSTWFGVPSFFLFFYYLFFYSVQCFFLTRQFWRDYVCTWLVPGQESPGRRTLSSPGQRGGLREFYRQKLQSSQQRSHGCSYTWKRASCEFLWMRYFECVVLVCGNWCIGHRFEIIRNEFPKPRSSECVKQRVELAVRAQYITRYKGRPHMLQVLLFSDTGPNLWIPRSHIVLRFARIKGLGTIKGRGTSKGLGTNLRWRLSHRRFVPVSLSSNETSALSFLSQSHPICSMSFRNHYTYSKYVVILINFREPLFCCLLDRRWMEPDWESFPEVTWSCNKYNMYKINVEVAYLEWQGWFVWLLLCSLMCLYIVSSFAGNLCVPVAKVSLVTLSKIQRGCRGWHVIRMWRNFLHMLWTIFL